MIKVYIGAGEGRKLVDAEVIRESPSRLWVRLPDGNVIARKKNRDLPRLEEKNG